MISGVRKNSPAWQAGLRKGDEILTVNGETPYSRVAAYGYLNGPGTRTVTYRSSQTVLEATWQNTSDGSCGIARAAGGV